ncbi:zinc finger CCCH domain-containing protein 3-like [Populus alba x Populus x berolinensis]|nr:zinc finger CCCH domain-containing protein 3-like [Populus alba x Populus x berolinensis]
MPDHNNRQVKSNAVSNQSADNIEEAFWRLKIHDPQEQGGMAQSSPYPDRPGVQDCGYYLRTGLCGYGSNCRFNHPIYSAQGTQLREELPERIGQPDCGYYIKTGTCKYGSTCKYHHPRDRNGAGPVSFNALGLPMRQDEKSCPYYMRTRSCKFGVACKFHHPQPASLGTSLPLAGAAAFGSTGSPIVPSSGLPYVGGLPTWSLPRAPPYMPGTHLQGPQAYMPVVVSPSQGIVPVPGWNTYVGNSNPMSSSSILGSNRAYDSRNHGDSGSSGQAHLLSTAIPALPERPDQPECRHFMSSGTCKYGSDCKYHHPKERIAQLATNTMGPFGLPLRPGQAVCPDYSMYGVCKFGPTCRYDHPLPTYPYNYSLSLPSLSMMDSSLVTYPRMAQAALSSATPVSLSKLPDLIRNPDGASYNKHQNSDSNTKTLDDPTEHAGSPPPHSSQASSEPSHD